MDARSRSSSASTNQTPSSPPTYIKATTATSYFSPLVSRSRQCCQCSTQNNNNNNTLILSPSIISPLNLNDLDINHKQLSSQTASCCPSCPNNISPTPAQPQQHQQQPFPASWICDTCSAHHSVLDILLLAPRCPCGRPALKAVYDQHGQIFLYWRDDPAVYDLREAAKVQEAAWRVWEAGAVEPWLEVVVAVEKGFLSLVGGTGGGDEMQMDKGEMGGGGGGGKWGRFSQSSISSEDSLDIEMAAAV